MRYRCWNIDKSGTGEYETILNTWSEVLNWVKANSDYTLEFEEYVEYGTIWFKDPGDADFYELAGGPNCVGALETGRYGIPK